MCDESPLASDGEVVIQPLISKLGHSVEEIRVRSLRNIIFKLDHDLICVGDVVHKKDLFVKLLEWFNFEPCPNQKDVLQLLDKLSKHSSGIETLVSIGGVEFLLHLRQDVEPALYQLVDSVLSNLLSLPEILDGEDEQLQLHYERGKSSSQDIFVQENAAFSEIPRVNNSQGVGSSSTASGEERLPHLLMSHPQERHPFRREQFCDKTQTNLEEHELHDEAGSIKQGTGGSWRYPWVRLADSDQHILSTTNTRLQSHNPSLVRKSCEFLNDVLFKDFPAEIFLQRPSIVTTLLSLLEVKSAENQFVPLSAASCLANLCVHLKQRYFVVSDPAWYSIYPDCWKHWLTAGSSSSSAAASAASEISDLRTTGDGGERSSESSKADSDRYVEVEGEDDGLVREALEMNQMTIEEFSLQVMRYCCPLLNSACDSLIILEALQEALKLLEACRPDFQWWSSHKLKPVCHEICCISAKTLKNHMLRSGLQSSEGQDIVEHTIPHHAMVVINISLWIINFLGPFLQVEWDNESAVQELSEVFQALIMNEIVFVTNPEIRTSLEQCPLVMGDSHLADVYEKALSVKNSFTASVKFLRKVKLKEGVGQDVLITTLKSSLVGIPYHRHLQLIAHAITLVSSVFERSAASAKLKFKAKEILLFLLSNVDEVVRRKSYKCCVHVVREALKYNHVTNPVSNHCFKAKFIVDCHVLYTMCAFGMVDQTAEIAESAKRTIEVLLESRLNMSSELWKKLLDDILASLPFLQMHFNQKSKLGSCLMGLLAPPGESHHSLTADGEVVPFSQFERLRGSLRCMLLRDKMLRAKGYGYVIRCLVEEDSRTGRDFVYPSGSLENSSNLFIHDTFASSVRLHRSTKHSNFVDEKIRKLFDIVAMETTEVSLRKSSTEQLAIIMQDPDWHSVLLNEVAEDAILRVLEESLVKDGKVHISSVVNPKLELVSPLLKILRLLAEYNTRCRRKLALTPSVYQLIVRHALLSPSGGTVRYEVSCLLTLLLFDEVAQCPSFEDRQENGDILFALPPLFLKRYSLPFNPPTFELKNPYQQGLLPEMDPLRTESVQSLTRVSWNLAWSDDPNSLPDSHIEDPDSVDEKLKWSSLDSQLLKSCSAKIAVSSAISSILQATTHHTVKLSVSKLSMHFLAENSSKYNPEIQRDLKSTLARELFYTCDWKTTFARYFTVYPKSADDDRLLSEVLRMFRFLIQEYDPAPQSSFLGWLGYVIMAPESSIGVLLSTPSPTTEQLPDTSVPESKRTLRKELLEFLSVFIRKLRGLAKPWLWSGQTIYAGDFTLNLTLNLNLRDTPQYYDLPILQSTLQTLVEITAIPGFSTAAKMAEPKELCAELFSSLLQVFTAFHAGRLGAIASFMGRGVTLCVSLCLAHLVHEISSVLKLQDWPAFFTNADHKEENSDDSWLSLMWTDHLPEVRWSSLAITSHVVSHTGSPLSIKQNIAGGLWNLAMTILMDGKESCLVRDQAVLLFSALLSCLKRNEELHESQSGLSVQTEHEIISGLPALDLLLTHHQFYQGFRQMLCNVIFENSPQLPGTTTLTESLISSSACSRYGIPYQSLDADSQSSNSLRDRTQSESSKMTSSSTSLRSGESSRRLLEKSPAESSVTHSIRSSSRPSSTVPLITRRKAGSDPEGNDIRSSTSPVSVDSLEIFSWVTPRFVGSLSGLVTNLVSVSPETVLNEVKEEDILGLFISLLDRKYAISLITKLDKTNSCTKQRHLEINLVDTLDMFQQIGVLMRTCAVKDPVVCHALQQNSAILEQLVELLTISSCTLSNTVQISCSKMWRSIVELLLILIQNVKESQLLETPLEEVLCKRWEVFAVCFRNVMLSSEAELRDKFLHLLSHLLLREGKRMISGRKNAINLAGILDKNTETKEEAENKETLKNGSVVQDDQSDPTADQNNAEFSGDGGELCTILLRLYNDGYLQDKNSCNSEEKKFVVAALRNLFCVSEAAKENAVKAGFLLALLDKVKQLHVHLNMESLEVGKGTAARKKEMDLISEIIVILELLKNLMFRSRKTKLEAINHGVVSVLQQLWSWCTVAKTLCLAVLELLCTLTARCAEASIAMSNTSCGVGSSVRLGPSNNTFVHCVIKMASKTCSKLLNHSTGNGNLVSCQILYSLLKNIAVTSECRGILWKSNFITEFSRLKSVSHQKWKTGPKIAIAIWLELLASITFYRDGQQMILKIQNIVPLLLEFSGSNTKRVAETAMLVLRNMCFHVPSKTLLLSNSEVVEVLLKSVEKPSVYGRALAASALWALLTNNQKAKSILGKPALVVKRLTDSKHTLKSTQGAEDIQRQHYEDAIKNILKILHC